MQFHSRPNQCLRAVPIDDTRFSSFHFSSFANAPAWHEAQQGSEYWLVPCSPAAHLSMPFVPHAPYRCARMDMHGQVVDAASFVNTTPTAWQEGMVQGLVPQYYANSMARGNGTSLVPHYYEHQSSVPSEQHAHILPSKVARGMDQRTTLMIANLPTWMTQEHFAAIVEQAFACCVDCVLLPLDWQTGGAVGYAFVNLTHPRWVLPFYNHFHGFCLAPHCPTSEVWHVVYAGIQGREALMAQCSWYAPSRLPWVPTEPLQCAQAPQWTNAASQPAVAHGAQPDVPAGGVNGGNGDGPWRLPRRERRALARAAKEAEEAAGGDQEVARSGAQ
jgi:hypothetical protein